MFQLIWPFIDGISHLSNGFKNVGDMDKEKLKFAMILKDVSHQQLCGVKIHRYIGTAADRPR